MSEKTERNLALALAAESQASARDTAFAQKADHDEDYDVCQVCGHISESRAPENCR
jgi:rubrerythrin